MCVCVSRPLIRYSRNYTVESPTEISRDFICNVTSSAWNYLAKSGQDGWLERSGDGTSLGQEYGAVSGGIGCQRIAFVND